MRGLRLLIVLCAALCLAGVIEAASISTDCISITDCSSCILETTNECAWCGDEGKCAEVNRDGTIQCTSGQSIFSGVCPGGVEPSNGFFQEKVSSKSGFTHGYVGIVLMMACLIAFRLWRSLRSNTKRNADGSKVQQEEAWKVMRRFRSARETKMREAKARKAAGYIVDPSMSRQSSKKNVLTPFKQPTRSGSSNAFTPITSGAGVGASGSGASGGPAQFQPMQSPPSTPSAAPRAPAATTTTAAAPRQPPPPSAPPPHSSDCEDGVAMRPVEGLYPRSGSSSDGGRPPRIAPTARLNRNGAQPDDSSVASASSSSGSSLGPPVEY